MKYKLIKEPTYQSALEQVLTNRGITKDKLKYYTELNEECISNPKLFGEDKLNKAASVLIKHIKNDDKAVIVIDPDVDGNTSAALLLNYLYLFFPYWVANQIDFIFHTGKQHGLNDLYKEIIEKRYKLVICPDSGSNDGEECRELAIHGIDVIILDHHDYDSKNTYAIIINNQTGYSDYPNKFLSGVGVVWQFCRYLDSLMKSNKANDFLDLVAVGLTGDMMSFLEPETFNLVQKGLQDIHNPFLYYLAEKNRFKLGEDITPIGAAFYIVPLLNAVQRSGTMEEKELVFKSMLSYYAFEQVPSTKRGHRLGEEEMLVTQAVRTATNVKNRQTKVQDASLDILEQQIIDKNLLNHKVLLLLLEEDNIPAEVRGLIANKFMAKYQRPCCLLTKGEEYSGQTMDGYRYETYYAGSARGCTLAGVEDFKQVCLDTGVVDYAVGHPNAFGLKIWGIDIPAFIEKTDEMLKDMSNEPIYYVDYIFEGQNVDYDIISDLSEMSKYWGTDVDEALVAIKGLKVSADKVDVYRKTSNTIKITLNNGTPLMLFKATDEECELFKDNNKGYVEVDIVAKANRNEFNGMVTAQLFIEDYEVTDSSKFYF